MTKIAVATDAQYAPCSYLICRVLNPDAEPGQYDWTLYNEEHTVLVQTDYDFPGLARTFGWNPCKGCDRECAGDTDGTVECASRRVDDMIAEARAFLDDCEARAVVVDDPGYFA